MQRVERRTTVAAPPEEVFALVADLDQLATWQTGVVAARRTSDGPMGVGATATVVREVMGQRIQAPLSVTAYEPPSRLVVASEVQGVRAEATIAIAPQGAGSAIDFVMEIRAGGIAGLMEPMIASVAGGDLDASLRRLRERFGGETA